MRWLAALVIVAGCAQAPQVERPSYRDRSVPIASQVDVQFAELEGSWVVRGAIGDWGLSTIVRFDAAAMEMTQSSDPYIDGEVYGTAFSVVTHSIRGFEQGRITAVATEWVSETVEDLIDQPSREYWILWADADRRTMAIGTPDGSFGFILDRERTGGEDRIAAAREIMTWMGYDLAAMVSAP